MTKKQKMQEESQKNQGNQGNQKDSEQCIKDSIILQGLFRNDNIYYGDKKYVIDKFICGSYDIFSSCTKNQQSVSNFCDCSTNRNVYDAVIDKQTIQDNIDKCSIKITNDSDNITFIIYCYPEVPVSKYIKLTKPVTIILK
jgi:hypothetical protein